MHAVLPNLTRTGNGYGTKETTTSVADKKFEYGTTGFRMSDVYLPCPVFRVAVYEALITLEAAANTSGSITSGIMITASHNVYTDNGAKAYGPGGIYYTDNQIQKVTEIVNMSDEDFDKYAAGELQALKKEYEARLIASNIGPSYVVVGYDTRKSSFDLANYAQAGIEFFDSELVSCIVLARPVTTPLHQVLLRSELDYAKDDPLTFLEKYCANLSQLLTNFSGNLRTIVDCANGVPSLWAKYFLGQHDDKFSFVNEDYEDFQKLNSNCGADFIKTTGKAPENCESTEDKERIASLDGDGDRLIYSVHYNGSFRVLDGDYQAVLFADFICKHYQHWAETVPAHERLSFGIATTRYANGAFDKALEKFGDVLKVMKGETGVANISALVKNMDIGIFFESNGHGSVFVSQKAFDYLKERSPILYNFLKFFEHPVGDGFANLLAVEYILQECKAGAEQWGEYFIPRASLLKKVAVNDLSQYKLDPLKPHLLERPEIVRHYSRVMMDENPSCRIYIRPSGTEPVLRVYVEGENEEQASEFMDRIEGMESDEEENTLTSIREKYPGYFERSDLVVPFTIENENDDVIDEDVHFPESISLHEYFETTCDERSGKSLFAHAMEIGRKSKLDSVPSDVNEVPNSISAGNDFRISKMSAEEIAEAKAEIYEKLSPESIQFLLSRHSKMKEEKKEEIKTEQKGKKVSAFRRGRLAEQGIKVEEKEEKLPQSVEEGVKNLEFFDPKEADNEEEGYRHSRLAVNAVQMDLALKSFALASSRPMNSWVELFEKLKKWECTSSDHPLVHRARASVSDIKSLYLEEYATNEDIVKYQFAKDVNPTTDGCWIFVPIRRIINVIEDRQRLPTPDDLDIVRLTLLFSVWFLKKQDTLFEMFAVPSDVAVHIAEVFILGPEVYADEQVSEMLHLWVDDYLIPKGMNQKLSFPRKKPIAKLSEFQSFYIDLIDRYKEHGGGHKDFFRMIMVFASMNSIPLDSLLTLEQLFNPGTAVVRQVDVSMLDMDPFIKYTEKNRQNQHFFKDNEEYLGCFEEYIKLLKFYTGIIVNEDITKERNPGVFLFAFNELTMFVDFWQSSKDKVESKTIDNFVLQLQQRIPAIGERK
ncbi:hypothetical protein FO519_003403 [Halicephalobus sp. NKZ332]|nr:hypothetical protein FO519_003403 [Halicephalobus sp. NKZ332]